MQEGPPTNLTKVLQEVELKSNKKIKDLFLFSFKRKKIITIIKPIIAKYSLAISLDRIPIKTKLISVSIRNLTTNL